MGLFLIGARQSRARVQRVQKVHRVQRGWWAAALPVYRKLNNRANARRKTSQTRFARWKTIQPLWRALEMHPFRLRHLPRRGRFALCFPVESCDTLLSIHSAPAQRGKGGAVRHQRGEKPPKVANHQNGNLADDSKGSGEQTSPSGVAKELDL